MFLCKKYEVIFLRVLIVGDAGSIFIKEYIEYVLLNKKCEIVLLQEGSVCESYRQFYKDNNVILEPLIRKENSLVFKIPKVRSYLGIKIWCNVIAKKYKYFDIVHIHGLNYSRGNIGMWLRKYAKKIFITVWGDEIFKKSSRVLNDYHKYYKLVDHITVSTKAMKDCFIKNYSDIDLDKLSINKFAIGLFDIIDECKVKYTRKELCNEFGIDSEKYIVLVGHNGREAQRHFEITEQLCLLPEKIKNKIVLVYTMTYGVKNSEYLENLKCEAQKTGCQYVILEDFMNEFVASKLRCISDILLHAQLTDAFSASIQECFYAGTVIINGKWLPYNEIPNYSDSVIEYEHINQLPTVLTDAIENYNIYKKNFEINKQVLRSISSREITTEAWINNLNL